MSEDLKRLSMLAKDGDRPAAEHLWNLALRQGDDDLATLAATALGDGQKLGQLGAALWQKADWTRLESLSRGFGVVLDKSAAGKIDGLMRAAHHGRHARLLSRSQVLEALWGALCSGDQYCFAHAGGALASPGRPMTTVVLVVARESQLTLGIAAAGAAMPSPGRGWAELQPWRRDERAANLGKLAVWAGGTLLPTKCLVSRTECPQAEVFRARDERQREVEGPSLDLEGALDEGEGPETFKRVVRLLDKWPKSHATALPSAVQLATERCRDWPVESKEAGKAWLNRALKGDIGNKPTDPLYKHLELRDVTDQTFAEMASCEALAQIESAELHFHPNHNHNNDHAGFRALMGSQVLRGLRQLTLHTPTYGERWGLGILMSSPNLPVLERLQVYGDNSLVDGLDGYALDLLALTCVLPVEGWETLLQSPRLRSLKELRPRIAGSDPRTALYQLVAQCPNLGSLESLSMPNAPGLEGAAALGATRQLPALKLLDVSNCGLLADAIEALLSGPLTHALEELRLQYNTLETSTGLALAKVPFTRLERLDLRKASAGPGMGSRGVQAILGSTWFHNIVVLKLGGAGCGLHGARAFADYSGPCQLQQLDLSQNNLDDNAADLLSHSLTLNQVEVLELQQNPALGSKGFAALAQSPHTQSLRALDLTECQVGPEGVGTLADPSRLPNLTNLVLNNNPVLDEGVKLFADAVHLERLSWLGLHQAGIKKRGKTYLEGARHLEGRYTGLPGFPSTGRDLFDF